MIANCHLGIVCHDLDKCLPFYRDILGLKEKFCLTYEDFAVQTERKTGVTERTKYLRSLGDRVWIRYMEYPDAPGYFIELFDKAGEDIVRPAGHDFTGVTHYAVIVDDLQAFKADVIARGGEEYIDGDIAFGCDNTYQLWLHDPEGNMMEYMQYTDKSFQVVGREE